MSAAGGRDAVLGVDSRMRGFKRRTSVAARWEWISAHAHPLEAQEVALGEAWGRVLARDIVAFGPVPPFDRAAMDAYAACADEAFGASAYVPAAVRWVGRSRPGRPCEASDGPFEAVEEATGAPLGADAVVPVEITRREGDRVFVTEGDLEGDTAGAAVHVWCFDEFSALAGGTPETLAEPGACTDQSSRSAHQTPHGCS
jgi:molybdopterin biosynthesis enzyme